MPDLINLMTRTPEGESLMREVREYDNQKLDAHLVITRAEAADDKGHSAEMLIDASFKELDEGLRLTLTLCSTALKESFFLKTLKLYAAGQIILDDDSCIKLPEVLYATLGESSGIPYFLSAEHKWELRIYPVVPID